MKLSAGRELTIVVVSFLATGALTACSSGGATVPATVSAPPVTEPVPTVESSPAAPAERYEQAEQLWTGLWAAIANPEDPAAWAALEGFVTADQMATAKASFTQYAGSEVAHALAPTAISSDALHLDDCLTQTLASGQKVDGLHYQGDLVWSGDRWTLSQFGLGAQDLYRAACVPRAENDAVLAAYRDFMIGSDRLSRRPDPASPEIAQITSDPYRTRFQDWLAGLQADGTYAVTYTDGLPLNPEVYAWAEGLASVTECWDAFPEYGVYGADGAPVKGQLESGTTSIYELDLALQEGTWKVTDLRESNGIECVKAPSSRGVAVIG